MIEVRRTSDLAAPPDVVWAGASTLRGVNRELGPWLRMTGPQDLPLDRAPRGKRSWLLLLGVLPVDFDDLVLEEVRPGEGFRERSTLLSARRWWHDRTLEPLPGGGTRLTDVVRFEPRLRAAGPVQRALVGAVFTWRHRRLRRVHR